MKPYPKYKPSGVPCLGDVPEHWEVKRIRFLARLNPRATRKLDPAERVSFLPMEGVGDDGSLKLEQTRPVEEVSTGYTYFEDGDVTVAKITPCFENGKGANMQGLTGGVGFGTTELIVIRPSEALHPQWLYLLTQTTLFRKRGAAIMQGAGGQKRVPDSYIKDFPVALPSDGEQFSIAAYLDAETARIDFLVFEKEKLIELLREYRQSVITEAVTKGLHPNVLMKPSGEPCLGDVPEHWDVVQSKRLFESVTSGSRGWAEYYSEAGDLFLRIGNLTRETIDLDLSDLQFVQAPAGVEGDRSRVQEGDLLVSITADLGSVAVVPTLPYEAYVSQHVALARPVPEVQPRWLGYAMRGLPSKLQLLAAGYGGTKVQLSLNDVKAVWLGLPSPTEQTAIAAYLDAQTTKIDGLIAHVQQEIELLKELRSATITDAVLGRIDLRDYTKKNKQGGKVSELQQAL